MSTPRGPRDWLGASVLALAGACAAPGAELELLPGTALPTQDATPPSAATIELASSLEQVFQRLKFYGDLRLRHESSFRLDGASDRNRERVRLRLGTNYQLNDELLVGARVTTGDPDDPNSTHVTLGDGFDSLEISLDRAFLTYTPGWLEGGAATAGKFNHPFYRNPVYGELVFDGDVQPEGAIASYARPGGAGPFEQLSVTLGQYLILEQSDDDEASAFVSQVSGRIELSDELSATLALGYYRYSDQTPDGAGAILGDNAGNATVDTDGDGTPDDFASDFGIVNPIIGVDYRGWELPLALGVELIHNADAAIGDDAGWSVGLAVGSAAEKGDVRVYYQYSRIEQDAVFSPFAQDDLVLATNHQSHLVGFNYQFSGAIGLNVYAQVSERDRTFPGKTTDSDTHQWRVRADLNIKF